MKQVLPHLPPPKHHGRFVLMVSPFLALSDCCHHVHPDEKKSESRWSKYPFKRKRKGCVKEESTSTVPTKTIFGYKRNTNRIRLNLFVFLDKLVTQAVFHSIEKHEESVNRLHLRHRRTAHSITCSITQYNGVGMDSSFLLIEMLEM